MMGTSFDLGHVVATPAVLSKLDRYNVNQLLDRHASGDWGDLGAPDRAANDYAVEHTLRIFSAYETSAGRAWIITEADRSSTCILLPEDY